MDQKYRYSFPVNGMKRRDLTVKAQKGFLEVHGSIQRANYSEEISHAFSLPSDAIMRSLKWYVKNGMLHISLEKRNTQTKTRK